MVESFFSGRQIDSHLRDPTELITLLSGPPSSGKTSLLFQFAFNSASATSSTNGMAVFICNRRRIETKPPCLSQGVDPSSDVFERVQMKYVDDDEEIKRYFAAFHMYDPIPVSIIIDDFGDFFNERTCQYRYNNRRGRDLAMVRVLALCYNAIAHANGRGTCSLLLSDTQHGDSPRLLYIYKRWVSSIYSITGDGSGSFYLKNYFRQDTISLRRMRTAKYSVALQSLVLEGITEETE